MLREKGKPFTIKDFIMQWGKTITPTSWKSIKVKMTQWAKRHNDKIAKEKEKKK